MKINVLSLKNFDNALFKDERKALEQHYKEIICTNNLLSKFLETISPSFNSKYNYNVIHCQTLD